MKKTSWIPVGHDANTGELVMRHVQDFYRGCYITGQSGQGKSELAIRILEQMVRSGHPAIIIDDAGKTHFRLEQLVAVDAAAHAHAMQQLKFRAVERYHLLKQKFLKRYTFGFIGHGRKNTVGIDILKLRRLPGRTETVEEVVIGNLKPFEARFEDISIRTRFLTVIIPLLTVLIAARRPISEALRLLLDPRYWRFAMRQIETHGVLDDPQNREYVTPRIQELRRILDLRYSKGTDPVEAEPYPQRFWDKVESTYNALQPYSPGTITAKFFEADTFSPENVVFGRGVFSVTTDLSDDLVRNHMNATIYTFFERLMKYRVPTLGLDRFQLALMIDEIRWLYEGLTRFFSVARNHRVTSFVLNQQDEQWEQLKMPALAKVLPSLLRMRIQYRPASQESAEQMASRLGVYDPFGLQRRELSTSKATGTSASHAKSETEAEAENEAETNSKGDSENEAETESDAETESEGRTDSESSSSSRNSAYGSRRNNSANDGYSTDPDGEVSTSYGWGNTSGDDETYGSGEAEQSGSAKTTGTSTTHGTATMRGTASTRGTATMRGKSTSRGVSTTNGTSTSEMETLVEHIMTASVADQNFLRAQELQRLPEHVALVSFENESRLVRMLPCPAPTATFTRRDVYGEFVTASQRHHAASRATRVAYEPAAPASRAPAAVEPAAGAPREEAPRPQRGARQPAARRRTPPKARPQQAAKQREAK
jgi:hypothetical protein